MIIREKRKQGVSTKMEASRRFWVRWKGNLADGSGKFDGANPGLHAFLRALSHEFAIDDCLTQPAIFAPGDGTISLASVIGADDAGAAVNTAKSSFERAIKNAGGKAELPDGSHPSWSFKELQELVHLLEAEVKELVLA
jgi:hypothetical protein